MLSLLDYPSYFELTGRPLPDHRAGGGRLKTLKEQVEPKGYAAGFETLIAFVNGLVPSNEVIGPALRKSVPMYPELAVRELVGYLHACLRYVNREYLTNASVRARFGLKEANSASASRLIKETVAAGLIAPVDENAAKRLMKYIPWWATADAAGPSTRRKP